MAKKSHPETLIAHAGGHDLADGAIVPAISPSTTFARDENYQLPVDGRGYARDGNPSPLAAEGLLAALEGGVEAKLFSSGMAAAVAVFQALRPGDHVVAQKVMYWGLRNWLVGFCRDWGVELTLAEVGADPLAQAIQPGKTKLVWVETPSNPLWEVVDIAAIAKAAHKAGAKLAVDSTVATPILTRPIELGADLVFHSATKYLNGHSDVVAGALITKAKDELWQKISDNRAHGGAIIGPFEAWLLLRGMRTLTLRVERACDNAQAFAARFEKDPRLKAVLYPGLKSHPGHEIAARQMIGGFSGMMSFRVKGEGEAALAAIKRLQLFRRATSLGGPESLAEHRATIEGANTPVPPDLLRLSIGLEHIDDLIADMDQALGN